MALCPCPCKIRVYSCPLVVRESSKFFPARFGSDCSDNDQRESSHQREQSKGLCRVGVASSTAEMLGQSRLYHGGVGRKKISKLISESWKGATHFTRRQLIQMHRDDSPDALHRELHQESAGHQHRQSGRENPRRN